MSAPTRDRHQTVKRAGRTTVIGATSLATLVCGLTAVAGPAHAVSGDQGTTPAASKPTPPKLASGKWVSAGVGNPEGFTDMKPAQMGNNAHVFVSSNGDVGICAQDEKDAPSSGWYVIPKKHLPSVTYTKQKYVTGAYQGTEGQYSKKGLQEMAFIASHYAVPLESKKAPLEYTAIDYIDGVISGDTKEHQSPSKAVTSRGKEMLKQAKLYYGPQEVKFVGVPKSAKLGSTSTIGVGAQSTTTNNFVPGEKLTLTITGGTFADGKTTTTVTTKTSAVDVKVKNADQGKVKITAKGKVAAPGMWLQTNGTSQNIWKVGHKVNIKGDTGYSVMRTTINPDITTKSSAVKANVGDTLYDTLSASGFPAGAKVSGSDTLYRVPSGTKVTPGQKVPDNAERVYTTKWSATADKDGKFTTKVGSYKVTRPGDYYWVESAAAGESGPVKWAPITGQFGDTDESTHVVGVSDLTITTKANEAEANVGDTLFDHVIGKGAPAGATVEGTDVLYRVPSGSKITPGQKIPDNAEKVYDTSWKATAGKDGTFEVKAGSFKVTKPGEYYWVETSKAGSYHGYEWGTTTGTFGDSTESTRVVGVSDLTVTTKANKTKANVGNALFDHVIGKGAPAGATIEGTDTLYRMPYGADVKPGQGIPDNAEKVYDTSWKATAGKDGTFEVKAGSFKVTKPGDYYWVETSKAGSYHGYEWGTTTGTFGDSTESTIVTQVLHPKVTTKASSQKAQVGDILYDTVMGSGFPANTTVSGSDTLYFVPDGIDVKLGVKPEQAEAIGTVKWSTTTDKDGKFSVKTKGIKADKAGQYFWVETAKGGSSGGRVWAPVTGQFGDHTESTEVNKPTPKPIPQPVVQTS